jgi:hypothetical protein
MIARPAESIPRPVALPVCLDRAAGALFASGLVLALREPGLKRRRVRLLYPIEPLFADRIRDNGLQPVVGVCLLDRIEDPRAIDRLTRRLEP